MIICPSSLPPGATAAEYFAEARLSKQDLSKIWVLVDRDRDGYINVHEFAAAMLLIRNQLAGVKVPSLLPPSLLQMINPVSFLRVSFFFVAPSL